MRNVINVCSCCNLRHAPMLIGLSYHSWPPLGLPRKTQEVHEGNKKRNPGHERIQSNMTHMILICQICQICQISSTSTSQRCWEIQRNVWFVVSSLQVRPQNSWLQGEARGPVACWPLAQRGDMGHHGPTKSKAAVVEQSRIWVEHRWT